MGLVEMERFAKGLTVFTFVLMCWVLHRTVQVRTDCVNSSFIHSVLVDGEKVYNCRFESRLNLKPLIQPLRHATRAKLRELELAEELTPVFGTPQPRLMIEVVDSPPNAFELTKRHLRLGQAWLSDQRQVRRALVMGVLKSEAPLTFASEFELEVAADFLALALFPLHDWSRSLLEDVRFPTVAAGFDYYCKSPLRSLAHHGACTSGNPADSGLYTSVWSYRALLAAGLWRVYDKATIREKLRAIQRLRLGKPLPLVPAPYEESGTTLAVWFTEALKSQLEALGLERNVLALKRTLKELQVEAPTHWELTVDITQTPAWREILEQLRKRSSFRPKERMLVFTPQGAVAFPSGFPVRWAALDIATQKHVMIACEWPAADQAVHVQARQVFAQHSCEKLNRAFWD